MKISSYVKYDYEENVHFVSRVAFTTIMDMIRICKKKKREEIVHLVVASNSNELHHMLRVLINYFECDQI